MAKFNKKIRLAYPEYLTISSQNAIHSTGQAAATSVTVDLDDAIPRTHQVLMGFQASSDASAALVQIKEDSTVVWEMRMGAILQVSFNFNGWLVSAAGSKFTIEVTGATAFASANLYGFKTIQLAQP